MKQPSRTSKNAYWYGVTDHFQLAAKYAFGIAKGHGFRQGNKRTGLVYALVFLGAQGHDISGYSNTALEAGTLGLVEDFISTEEFAELSVSFKFGEHSRKEFEAPLPRAIATKSTGVGITSNRFAPRARSPSSFR